MPTKSTKRRCCYCRKIFKPDPRVGDQQKTCATASCCKKRKQQAQKRWVKKNPGYFKGRYESTCNWLNQHPGYLINYRQAHPQYVEQNRQQQRQRNAKTRKNRQQNCVDIQDTITTQPTVFNGDRLNFVDIDIQDAIRMQTIVPVYVNPRLGDVDIQDTMATRSATRYTSAIMITAKKLQSFRKNCHER